MWSGAAFSLSFLVLVSAQGSDFSENRNAQANDADQVHHEENNDHEDVVLQEHHLSKHTKSHNPCAFRHCKSREICKVVINPALQFPVAHCEDAFSLAGAPPTSASASALSCDDAELSTNPMACRTPDAWEKHARDHCGEAKMSGFKVSTECLSFDPTSVYQSASFQCCSERVVPAQQQLPPKRQVDTGSAKPESKAPAQAPAKKVPAKQASKTTPQPQKKPTQESPEPQSPRTPPPPPPSQKSQAPTETKAIPKPKIPVTQDRAPEEPERPTGLPQDDVRSPTPGILPDRKDSVDDEEKRREQPEADGIQEKWFAVMAGGVVVVIAIVAIGVVVRLTRRRQVLHKPRQLLSDARGATLTTGRRSRGDGSDGGSNGEEYFLSAEADGLVYDDMEVQNFVNPSAVYGNTAAIGEDEPAIIEPFDIQEWEMDGNTMPHHHHQHFTNTT